MVYSLQTLYIHTNSQNLARFDKTELRQKTSLSLSVKGSFPTVGEVVIQSTCQTFQFVGINLIILIRQYEI